MSSQNNLTAALQVADYGLIEGETLDEEGRVIPPWAGRAERFLLEWITALLIVECFANRYAGPVGEDEVRYPHDYGYGTRGFIEASRGKVPPPQVSHIATNDSSQQ